MCLKIISDYQSTSTNIHQCHNAVFTAALAGDLAALPAGSMHSLLVTQVYSGFSQ